MKKTEKKYFFVQKNQKFSEQHDLVFHFLYDLNLSEESLFSIKYLDSKLSFS